MSVFRRPSSEPLWRDEFSVRADHERYVSRRQFGKFMALTSLGMFAGQVWILVKAWRHEAASRLPVSFVAAVDEVPVGSVKLFRYPSPADPCIMVRLASDTFVAYSQKCTHLSCAVYYSAEHRRLECPCHEGYFSVTSGRVLQGPPPRALPRIQLERRGDEIFATGVRLEPEQETT